jgi:hypothetical protein
MRALTDYIIISYGHKVFRVNREVEMEVVFFNPYMNLSLSLSDGNYNLFRHELLLMQN